MRRGYTRERYIDICDRLKEARQNMSITTDIIVGFCGETDDDFNATIDLMKHVEFDSIFAFKYSPRPGTEAANKFEDDVPQAEKDLRLEEVLGLQRKISIKRNEVLIGSTDKALTYGMDRMKRGLLTGRLPDNRIVHFAGNQELIGDIVSVRIMKTHKNSLAGEIII